MNISMLVSNTNLCEDIRTGSLQSIRDIFYDLDKFNAAYLFPEKDVGKLYELLYKNRRDEDCVMLSRKLEREIVKGKQVIRYDETAYNAEMAELKNLCAKESLDFLEVLKGKGEFSADVHKLYYGKEQWIRSVQNGEKLQRVLILFGESIDSEQDFAEYLRKVYSKLWFDKDIGSSMRHLEAGLSARKKEILYHLYCIETEIPLIIEKHGMLSNQDLGDKLSIPCSPERNRDIVKTFLVKKADHNQEVKCELHTKMKKIGGRKPDRIYFCANVPGGVEMEGESAKGRIFIYKITKHV